MPSLLLIGLASCKDNDQAKTLEFAQKAAEYVKANRPDSLQMYYPQGKFDSLAFAKPYEVIELETLDSTKNVRAKFGEGAYIEITKSDDGTFSIVNSKGIAAFPASKLEIAQKTGMLKGGETDIEIASLIADEDFFTWLNKKDSDKSKNLISLQSSKSRMGACYGEGNYAVTMNVTITNNSGADIKGSDYSIKFTKVYSGEESTNWRPSYGSGKQSGVDLKAGETKNITLSAKHVEGITKPSISWNIDPATLATPTSYSGSEYSEYLSSTLVKE